MMHKSKIMPATSPSFSKLPYLAKCTLLIHNIDAFQMCNILKFTQDSLALIPYLLTYSQQRFVSIMDENLTRWNN